MARRSNSLTKFLQDVVDNSKDLVDDLVDRAGRSTETRLAVMSLDGVVVGDTSASGEALRQIENHGTRPEVQDALALGEGTDEYRGRLVVQDLDLGRQQQLGLHLPPCKNYC